MKATNIFPISCSCPSQFRLYCENAENGVVINRAADRKCLTCVPSSFLYIETKEAYQIAC